MMNRRNALQTVSLAAAAVAAGANLQAQDAAEPCVLPELPYPADSLEPHLDANTMRIHREKHHAAYVRNANTALMKYPELAAKPLEEILEKLDEVPEEIRTTVRNNVGGHLNHSLFWQSMAPKPKPAPTGNLMVALNNQFGGVDAFYEKFTQSALALFGSGWVWLALTPDKKLVLESLPNQDSPYLKGNKPLLGIDVWEHAYYLRYQNRRADYVRAFRSLIHWEWLSARYDELHG